MKSFNTNHEIYVKLTERGQQLVLEHKHKLNEDIGKEIVEVTPYPVDENGLSKIQLWHFSFPDHSLRNNRGRSPFVRRLFYG